MAVLALEMASRPAIAAPIILLVSYVVYQLFIKPSDLPDIPIIGARKGWFPLLQTKIRNSIDVKSALNSSYAQYKDQATTKFASEQPTDALSMHEQVQNSLQTDYTTMDPSLIHDPVHHDLIATTLTKEIGNLIPGLVDEIDCCLNKHWGNNSKWKEVCIAETTQRILSGVNNRAFIGLPCCRNAPMLQSVIAFAQDLPLSLLILKAFPSILKPIVAPLITLPKRIHTNSFQSILAPEIKARLEEYDARNYGIQTTKSERNDFLQWSIEQAKDDGTSRNWQVGALAQRILLLNFVAIHTSTFAVTHALLDIASSSPDLVKELRLEVKTVLDYHGNQGSKRPLAQMGKLDSAIRESQRKNTFVAIGVGRVVIAEKGVTFPSGTHVRKGLSVAVPGYSVLQDPEVYPDSKTYQPLRFYKARHGIEDDNVKSAREALPTTSQNFLGWGSGRSACPGRFFASNEIKTMIAYISLRYDIEHLPERPRNTWIAQNRIPPMRATLRIRRKTSD